MKADSFRQIGQPHIDRSLPCQDYTLSKVLTSSAFAIAADGCSTGGHTDMGSAVLTFASARVFDIWDGKPYPGAEAIMADLRRQWKCAIGTVVGGVMSLEPKDMYATALCAFVTQEGGFVHMQGDGVYALKYLDGRIVMRNYEWARPNPKFGGAPPYPLYSLEGYNQFVQLHGGDENAEKLTEETWERKATGELELVDMRGIALGVGKLGTTQLITADELPLLESVSVFTDGVCAIQGHQKWPEVVAEILSSKNPNAYARRMLRGVLEDWAKENPKHVPMDDISMAIIHPNH